MTPLQKLPEAIKLPLLGLLPIIVACVICLIGYGVFLLLSLIPFYILIDFLFSSAGLYILAGTAAYWALYGLGIWVRDQN